MNAAAQPEYAIVVAAHGSRDPASLRECESLVQLIKDRATGHPVVHGYLEFAAPTIDEAVRTVVAAGARRVVLLPALLFAAMHAKNDMPAELAWIQQAFPGVEFHFGASLDLHPYLLRLAQQRIVEAEGRSGRTVKRSGTCLVVVGRGTSDPDANSEVSKLARMLEEGMGFGASFVCYSGTAIPNVTEGLRTAARLGFERMIVFPYFLFDGRLIKRIYAAADALPRHDLYLLTDHDGVPWRGDGLREGDLDVRAAMTSWFEDTLVATGQSWVLLTGSIEERVALAIRSIEPLLERRLSFTAPKTGPGFEATVIE